MINNTIAKRYAKALVQLSSENGLVDSFRKELAAINELFAANANVGAAFANPAFTAEQKKQIMKELVAKCGCSASWRVTFSSILLRVSIHQRSTRSMASAPKLSLVLPSW